VTGALSARIRPPWEHGRRFLASAARLALVLHADRNMARNTVRNPRSYDDIVRQTVVEPDTSIRPTREQEQAAREGFRALDPDEQVLHDRVVQALATLGADASRVTAEISRELVTLRGQVADVATLRRIEDAVAYVTGVETIYNQVVVAAS
jgi:osmotically-inducible protein OsmY